MCVLGVKHKIPYTSSRYPVGYDGPNDSINDEKVPAFAFTTAYNLWMDGKSDI